MRNLLCVILMLVAAAPCMGAEAYPAKPVHIIVPLAPAGTADIVGRVIAQQLAEQMGKPFVVENRVGASGIIGSGFVAKSAPDGYTLMIADTIFAIIPSLSKAPSYDPLKDFTPITQIIGTPQMLIVSTALKVNTLKEFIALAQANPGKFNYASGGAGGTPHLSVELFKNAAKVNIVHVPYKGGSEMLASVIGGESQMIMTGIPTLLSYVKSGRVRALAVATDGKRSPAVPDVPSMAEAGLPGMTIYGWEALVGPAGMSVEIVNKLRAEVARAVAVPAVKDQFLAQGTELVASSPEDYAQYLRNEVRRWAEVVKVAGATID